MDCSNTTGCGRLVSGVFPQLLQDAMAFDVAGTATEINSLATKVVTALRTQYVEDEQMTETEKYVRIVASVSEQVAGES